MADMFSRQTTRKEMDTNQILAGGFFLGLLATCWSKLKLLAARALSLLIVQANVEAETAQALMCYCWKHFKRSPFGARRYSGFTDFVRPIGRQQAIAFETVGKSPLVFWQGWRPLILQYDTAPKTDGPALTHEIPISMTFIRYVFDSDTLLIKAIAEYNALRHTGNGSNRFAVRRFAGNRTPPRLRNGGVEPMTSTGSDDIQKGYMVSPERRIIGWRQEDLGVPRDAGNPLETMFLTKEAKDLVEKGRRWLNSEKWYKDHKIPWRRGWLLFGPPGTGKSTMVRSVGQVLDLPVYIIDLSSFENAQFIELWSKLMANAPCIMLLEDIDNVFHGRKNITSSEGNEGLTFDCLLNCMSGVSDGSGILTVITTNRPEFLDEALGIPDSNKNGVSTRPGRIDDVVEMAALPTEGRRHLAMRILDICPEEIDRVVNETAGYTGAQVEDICTQIALEYYWRSNASRTDLPNSSYSGEMHLQVSQEGVHPE